MGEGLKHEFAIAAYWRQASPEDLIIFNAVTGKKGPRAIAFCVKNIDGECTTGNYFSEISYEAQNAVYRLSKQGLVYILEFDRSIDVILGNPEKVISYIENRNE